MVRYLLVRYLLVRIPIRTVSMAKTSAGMKFLQSLSGVRAAVRVIKAAKERLEKRHKEAHEKDKKEDTNKDGGSPPAKMQADFTDPEKS